MRLGCRRLAFSRRMNWCSFCLGIKESRSVGELIIRRR